ncbi:unnamed protein product [Rhizoctonia solani]|uniref:Transmembrane protein n=1 Tax=Rhizoctonia solani TaxID=456999 RepID=A0A8H3HJ78_9AGAM|nr:unnamed protein product [Rhizoctonia solani]
MARSFVVGALAAIALLATQAHAQTDPIWSNVTCTEQTWSINSAGQSPCLVSAHLSAQCTTDNSWGVPAIGTTGPYSPPNGTYANRCRCNSVQWNLLSACSMCQGGGAGTWQRWTVNCSSSVITTPGEGGYPLTLPSGVQVPHWAYYDFTASGVFNAVIASQQTGAESSAVAATPTGSSASATGAPATTTAGEATSTGVPGGNNSKSGGSNTGAIVGGVVGGILGIALIGIIAFIVVRKGKQNKNAGAPTQYDQSQYAPSMAPQSGAPMMGQYQPAQHSGMSPVAGTEYKPYDPRFCGKVIPNIIHPMIFGKIPLALVALFAIVNIQVASAQVTSNVTTCVQEYQWTMNSMNQTPCLQSGYLSAQCNGGNWNVPGIPGGAPYKQPQGNGATICRCNTVVWNLIQACSLCQGGRTASWGNWISNCSTNVVTIGSYPRQLPPFVAIPGWAYLDFTSQGTFQPQPARQAAVTASESKSAPAQTQRPTSVGTATSTATSTLSNSGSNAGAIAGGVVGGVVGLALLVILAWFILRKRTAAKGNPQPIQETYLGEGYTGQRDQGTGYAIQPHGTGKYTPVPASQSEGHEPEPVMYEQPYASVTHKPYDPSDPSTFPPPVSLASSTPQPSSQGRNHSEHGHQQQTRPKQYNYIPEV